MSVEAALERAARVVLPPEMHPPTLTVPVPERAADRTPACEDGAEQPLHCQVRVLDSTSVDHLSEGLNCNPHISTWHHSNTNPYSSRAG